MGRATALALVAASCGDGARFGAPPPGGDRPAVDSAGPPTAAAPPLPPAPSDPAVPPPPSSSSAATVPEPPPPDAPAPGQDLPAPALPGPCPPLYADDLLPEFELDISDADWAALHEDLLRGEEPYRPAVFRHEGRVVADAMVRLRGNNSACFGKLQLAIAFNQVNPAGRYHGLRRINLDHAGCNMLEERLALSYLRDLGLPAACANHARLVVNGAYYGLFVNVEHVNKDFLRRQFGPELDDGNLYKSGWRLRTNESTGDLSDLVPYDSARDVATLEALVDLEEAVAEWAAEAVMPARDNYWFHGWNYYLYHHPSRGFLFVPTDLDQAFPGTSDEIRLGSLMLDELQHPASIVLPDRAWRGRYEDAVRRAVAAYDPDVLSARLDRWWAQIAASAAEDPHFAYPEARRIALESRVRGRAAWLRGAVEDPSSW